MKEIIIDTLVDSLKLLPFLFVAFFIIELIEHKLDKKNKDLIAKNTKFGPTIGALLGLVPQCGFSVMATNLYVTRIISLGTLIAIYLSTSDEMIPILLADGSSFKTIALILSIKFIIGMLSGYFIDLFLRKQKKPKEDYEICENENCHCEKSLLVSSLIHTLKILVFLIIITFILNVLFEYVGNDALTNIFMKNSIFGPFLTSLIGLIPNCGSSIIISKLYLEGMISLGATISGLLTGSGVALLVLFRTNKNLKENLLILMLVYLIGALSGIIIGLIELLV
ncbi:MAG: arsenic efflux protein [Erysipelotrichaceae bacterium]|nr:arsenic efflux protein [Erysipelotrichaceae bacterium]